MVGRKANYIEDCDVRGPIALSSWSDPVEYDFLLDMEVPQGVQLVDFADDLTVVGVTKTSELLENLLNPVIEKTDNWMTTRGLQLAHHKTEAVILTKKWAYNPPQLSIGGTHI